MKIAEARGFRKVDKDERTLVIVESQAGTYISEQNMGYFQRTGGNKTNLNKRKKWSKMFY